VTSFGVLALLLASIGIFGVVANVVSRRRAEIGVRVALGADPRRVCTLMLRQGMSPVAFGLIAGILIAAATTRFMAGLLFEIRPLDPVTYVGAALFLGIVATAASYLPARRASQIDPIEALRYQ
jgi:ABC-type antimicrobial peptide transport system permease subunit